MDTNQFTALAEKWDENPFRIEMTRTFISKIQEIIDLPEAPRHILDIGAGTGNAGIALAGDNDYLTCIDTSAAMLQKIRKKALQIGKSINLLELDPGKESIPGLYDIIISQMAFHHIEDLAALVTHISSCTKNYGYTAISDLLPENGTFHPEGIQFVHPGIDSISLEKAFNNEGYTTLFHDTIQTISKPTGTYHIFLLLLRKES